MVIGYKLSKSICGPAKIPAEVKVIISIINNISINLAKYCSFPLEIIKHNPKNIAIKNSIGDKVYIDDTYLDPQYSCI